MKRIFGAKTRLLVSVLALACILAVGGTLAVLYATDDPVVNQFSLVDLDTRINESGTGADKTVSIKNKGESPAWVRARLMVSGIAPDKVKIVTAHGTPAADEINLVLPDNAWETVSSYSTLMSSDGWIHYTVILQPGADTGDLLAGVDFGAAVDPAQIAITVTHESVLALDADGTCADAFSDPIGPAA